MKILDRRDWVYLLSLLIPFAVYDLYSKLASINSQPGEHELAQTLELIRSDALFDLGYTLLWIGLFAATRGRGALRWAVVFLLHAATILIVIVSTCADQYFEITGSTLDYNTIAEWIPKFNETVPVFQMIPLSAWMLLSVALLYAALGPFLLTRAVEQWRGWSQRFQTRRLEIFPFVISLGLCFLAFGFGSLSLDTGTTTLARDQFVNVILPGGEETSKDNSDAAPAVKGDEQPEDDSLDTAPGLENPAAHATLEPTSQTQKRNVVLVHLESTRARSVTPYNEDLKTTPFLNELAKNSLLIEQMRVGSIPRSSMANDSIQCGVQPPPRSGPDEPGSMPVPCLASLLRTQGYSTVFFSSNADEYGDLATKNWGYEQAFAPPGPDTPSQYADADMDIQNFASPSHYGYEEDIMLKPSEEWLTEHKDKPFVAEYMTNTGHDEYRCLETRYGSENFSNNDLLNHYLNCLRLQDIFLQNLFDQYKKLGLYDNTIFVLFGDHGEGMGEHGRFMHGDTIWEEGLRVPLIIHAPGWFENGQRVEGPASQIDVLPTVLEMLGYQVTNGECPGYSLLHPLPEDRTLMFSCISPRKCLASIKGNEKYIYHFDNQPEEIFDLSQDPLEEHNLASQYSKEDLDKRRRDLFAWLSKIDAQYGHGALSWGGQPQENTALLQAEQSGEQPAEPTVAIGQPLRVGTLEWTVTDAYPTDQISSAVDSGIKQGKFVVVDYQLKNNSDEGLDLSSQSVGLVGSNGLKLKFDTDTYLYIDWSKVLFRFEIAPGDSQEGRFIFEVPQDASQLQLQLGGRNPFSNNTGYINLGF